MDRIEHSGVVKRVDAERVCVEITAHGACGGCKAREACGLGETGQKIVEIRTPAAATYRPGDNPTNGSGRGFVGLCRAFRRPDRRGGSMLSARRGRWGGGTCRIGICRPVLWDSLASAPEDR